MIYEVEVQALLREVADEVPFVLLLRGDLGAGKTTFVKSLLSALGLPPDQVQSPTFLKLMEHDVPGYGLCLHLDAYRMEEEEEFSKLALESYGEARAWLVEWPDLFCSYLANNPRLATHLGIRRVFELEILEVEKSESRLVRWQQRSWPFSV